MTAPAPDPSDVGAYSEHLVKGLIAASDAFLAETERQQQERRNRPEARARRSAGSRKGWATRRAREAAEIAEERDCWDYHRPDGPVCDGIYHDTRGVEMSCSLPPGHDDEDCGDFAGVPARKDAS